MARHRAFAVRGSCAPSRAKKRASANACMICGLMLLQANEMRFVPCSRYSRRQQAGSSLYQRWMRRRQRKTSSSATQTQRRGSTNCSSVTMAMM
eukprot:3592284-Prymnesium_polylepis.1